MEVQIFLSVFFLIFLAELPDKTAFATFILATRSNPYGIFAGVAAAFVIQSIVAVGFGSLIGKLPEVWVHTAAGLLFIGFAAHTLLFHDKEEKETEKETKAQRKSLKFWKAAANSFTVIFIAEWGDLTQLATASLAARYHQFPLLVFSASTLALWTVTAIAVIAGNKAGHVVHVRVIKYVSAAFMTIAGVYFIADAWM